MRRYMYFTSSVGLGTHEYAASTFHAGRIQYNVNIKDWSSEVRNYSMQEEMKCLRCHRMKSVVDRVSTHQILPRSLMTLSASAVTGVS